MFSAQKEKSYKKAGSGLIFVVVGIFSLTFLTLATYLIF